MYASVFHCIGTVINGLAYQKPEAAFFSLIYYATAEVRLDISLGS